MNNDTFICNEGKIAFILPFSYNQSTKKRKNFWDRRLRRFKSARTYVMEIVVINTLFGEVVSRNSSPHLPITLYYAENAHLYLLLV